MRTTTVSRSIIFAATLAVGAAAMTAAPADATTSSGVTREVVLTVAHDVRQAEAEGQNLSSATLHAVSRIATRTCGFEYDGDSHFDSVRARAVTAGPHADGALISVQVHEYHDDASSTLHYCTFTALATTDPAFGLSGAGSVSVSVQPDRATTTSTFALSGDVFTSVPIVSPDGAALAEASTSASGAAARPYTVRTVRTIADKKTTKQKKAARKAYAKRLAAAKKTYAKALKTAGGSTVRRTAARRAYAAAKRSARAKYRVAVADVRIVRQTVRRVESRPFSTSATLAALA